MWSWNLVRRSSISTLFKILPWTYSKILVSLVLFGSMKHRTSGDTRPIRQDGKNTKPSFLSTSTTVGFHFCSSKFTGYYLLLPKLAADEIAPFEDKKRKIYAIYLSLENYPWELAMNKKFRRLLGVLPEGASIIEAFSVFIPEIARLEKGLWPSSYCYSLKEEVCKILSPHLCCHQVLM